MPERPTNADIQQRIAKVTTEAPKLVRQSVLLLSSTDKEFSETIDRMRHVRGGPTDVKQAMPPLIGRAIGTLDDLRGEPCIDSAIKELEDLLAYIESN
jgi:hypothetical protein